MCNPPPQGYNGTPYVPKVYASSGIDISKCIEYIAPDFSEACKV